MSKTSTYCIYLLAILIPTKSYASNFGNFPAVFPIFIVGILISFAVAISKSSPSNDNNQQKGFNFGTFFGTLILGIIITIGITIILFSFTF